MEGVTFTPTERGGEDALGMRLLSIAQHILVVVFGLLPIIFIPSLASPVGYTKVLFVVGGMLAALMLYGLAILRLGTLRGTLSWPMAMLWLTSIGVVSSAVLSSDFADSFIGNAFEVHTALFVVLLALTASVWAFIGADKKVVMRLYMLLAVSTVLLAFFHILRLIFGVEVLSLGVFGDLTLTPLGGWNDLAIFSGLTVILSLVALEYLPLGRRGKVLFSLVVVAALVLLAVINFFAVWVVLGLVSLVSLVYAVSKDRFRKGDPIEAGEPQKVSLFSLGVSLATLVVSIVFVVAGSSVSNAITNATGISYVEVRPSLEATADITQAVYRDNVLFGIGPNRFADAWRLHKDASINGSVFWNTDFTGGIGYIPTFFATTGIVGGALWVAFLAWFVVSGFRMFMRASGADHRWRFVGVSSFVAGLYLWGISVIYVPGPVLLLLAAMATGVMGTSATVLARGRTNEYNVGMNQRTGFLLIAGVMVLIIASVTALYYVGRHYSSVLVFNQSLLSIQEGAQIEQIEADTVRAYALSENDRFARRIAEYQLARLNSLLSAQNPTEEQQAQFTLAFQNGVSAGETATGQDPTDPRNWSVLGNIYATLVPAQVEGALDRAENALARARELDPHNPSRTLALAQLAYLGGDEARARELINESIRMKQNYSEAVFFLSQIDIAAGNTENAIAAARAITTFEPQNPVRYFQLGVLELSANQVEGAARSLSQAVALDRDYANAKFYLALALDNLGQSDAARQQLEEVLALNPGNEVVTNLLDRLDQGESLLVPAPGESQPVDESGVSVGADGAVTTDTSPDTPLVTPVNTPTEEADDNESTE